MASAGLLSLCMVAALVSYGVAAPPANSNGVRVSPCPEGFSYDASDHPGQWTGTLLLQTDSELSGTWLRIIFDQEVKDVEAPAGYEAVFTGGEKTSVLLKNRKAAVKANSQTPIKITVKYDGNNVPNLSGYRLNGKTVCPEPSSLRSDFFRGDGSSFNYLSVLSSQLKPSTPQPQYECGLRPVTDSSSYPWRASLIMKDSQRTHYNCEGTLISPKHVLASAHCVTFLTEKTAVPKEFLSVYLGKSDKTERFEVKKILVHPGYEPHSLFNDLAIVQLISPVEINDYIRPICLTGDKKWDQPAIVVGHHIENGVLLINDVADVEVQELPVEECIKKNPGLKHVLADDERCVSYVTDKVCVGTSGSSVVSFRDKVANLNGIVSLGGLLQDKPMCNKDSTVVVTDVSSHIRWIRNNSN